jgi:predicted DNA-binding antitoxin AbrB/MazE fold protein
MDQTIHAVFKDGVFRPVQKINLPENQEVEIVIQEDAETAGIAHVAENGGALDYLSDPQEDIYSIADGEPLE